MNRIIVVAAILFTVGACQLRTAEPVNTSERIPAEQISLGGVLADELSQTDHAGREVDKRGPVYMATIEELQKLLGQTKSTGTDLDDTEIGERWENLNTEITNTFESLTTQDLNAWVALNDSLLKYTQQVRFADALERVVYNPVNDVLETDQVKSFYFTRLYDRIYFNVFGSSSLHYEHTTGGVVRIVQDTDYPFDGRVSIKLELQDKRYLDLFIRIPEWANRASVTVKGVKYNVVPGQYTEIAKKWKNGDEVEIILGMRPELVSREKPTKAFSLNYGFAEIIEKGPLNQADSKIIAGTIIEKIDGNVISKNESYYPLLNHKAGKKVLLSLYNPYTKERWEETVKPVSSINTLLYERWVKKRQEECERLSNGRIGYVHVKGMDSQSYRKVYSEILGKYGTYEAIIVDTRFNGGGWLHDDLATLLSGKVYSTLSPRGQDFGTEPLSKWKKPSAVLISESNYSDACAFPYVYKTLKIGKLVGMPVPGTMTAVWWETLQDPTLYFGMPMVGVKDTKGKYIENHQIEPDIKVRNDYEVVTKGDDQQLKKAVESLLNEIDEK